MTKENIGRFKKGHKGYDNGTKIREWIRGSTPCKQCDKGHHARCRKMEYCSCNCPYIFRQVKNVNQNHYKTDCIRGHEFTIDNVFLSKTGTRYCRKCWDIYREQNRQKIRKQALNHYHKSKIEISMLRRIMHKSLIENLKREVLTHYGNEKLACVCCGELTYQFLTIDHINNDGNEDRKIVRRGGHNIYRYLKKNNFPKGYQTLCMNCNFGKHINKGICPHKSINTISVFIKNMRITRLAKIAKEGDLSRLN